MRGIYIIKNKENGKIYVGSSLNVYARFSNHVMMLRAKKHANIHLQRAWNEYVESAFEMSIVELINEDSDLIQPEQVWIDKLDATNRNIGYNISACAKGRPMPEEVKAKIRAKHIGKKLSAEHREKMAAAKRGKPSWNKGLHFSDAHKAALSESKIKFFQEGHASWNKGIKMSNEQKLKVSVSRTGKGLGNTHGFQKGKGFWTGKKRPNISGENHWSKRRAEMALQLQGEIIT